MRTLGKAILLIIILAIGLYYFLQTSESEPYKLESSIVISAPSTVVVDERFYVTANLTYTIQYDAVPEEIKHYITQYGNKYIIGDKKLILERKLGIGDWTLEQVAYTNDYGQATFTLILQETATFRISFEGSSFLQSCVSEEFTIQVVEQSQQDISLTLDRNYVDVVQGSSVNVTLTVQSLNGYSNNLDITVTTSAYGINVIVEPSQFFLESNETKEVVLTVNVQNDAYIGYQTININVESSDLTKTATLHINVIEYTYPIVDIYSDKVYATLSETVTVYSTVNGGESPYSYVWYLNETVHAYNTTTIQLSSTYPVTYVVKLIITDVRGNSGSDETTVHFIEGEKVNLYLNPTYSRLDVDSSGYIDETDAEIISDHFTTNVTSENAMYDINEDGAINTLDVQKVALYFNTIVTADIYVHGNLVYSGLINKTVPLGIYLTGDYDAEIYLVTGEESQETLHIQTTDYYWSPKLNNPWKAEGTLALFELTGNMMVDLLRFLALTAVITSTIALIYLIYKERKK